MTEIVSEFFWSSNMSLSTGAYRYVLLSLARTYRYAIVHCPKLGQEHIDMLGKTWGRDIDMGVAWAFSIEANAYRYASAPHNRAYRYAL